MISFFILCFIYNCIYHLFFYYNSLHLIYWRYYIFFVSVVSMFMGCKTAISDTNFLPQNFSFPSFSRFYHHDLLDTAYLIYFFAHFVQSSFHWAHLFLEKILNKIWWGKANINVLPSAGWLVLSVITHLTLKGTVVIITCKLEYRQCCAMVNFLKCLSVF